jgi:hypothetical protein
MAYRIERKRLVAMATRASTGHHCARHYVSLQPDAHSRQQRVRQGSRGLGPRVVPSTALAAAAASKLAAAGQCSLPAVEHKRTGAGGRDLTPDNAHEFAFKR